MLQGESVEINIQQELILQIIDALNSQNYTHEFKKLILFFYFSHEEVCDLSQLPEGARLEALSYFFLRFVHSLNDDEFEVYQEIFETDNPNNDLVQGGKVLNLEFFRAHATEFLEHLAYKNVEVGEEESLIYPLFDPTELLNNLGVTIQIPEFVLENRRRFLDALIENSTEKTASPHIYQMISYYEQQKHYPNHLVERLFPYKRETKFYHRLGMA